MKLRRKKFELLFIYLTINLLSGGISTVLITPKNETVLLEFNDNYEILCEDNQPVEWIYGGGEYNTGTLEKRTANGLLLTFQNVTSASVGEFCCITKLGTSFKCIYIFVNGGLVTPKNKTVLLNLNDSYKLLCEDSEPVQWSFRGGEYNNGTFEKRTPKGLLLTLQNVSSANVGQYCCRTKLSIVFECIQIFVNDPNALLVPMTDRVMQIDFNPIYIPCKPTKTGNIVLLIGPDGRVIHENYINFSDFDLYGPNLNNLGKGNEGLYTCRPKFPLSTNLLEGTSYFFLMLDELEKISAPNPVASMTSFPSRFGVDGTNLILKCFVEQPNTTIYKFNWKTPNKDDPAKMSRAESGVRLPTQKFERHPNYEESTKYVVKSEFMVKHFQQNDEGYYECLYADHHGNILANGSYYVKYLGKEEHYLNLSTPNVHFTFQPNKTEFVEFFVNFQSFPTSDFTWTAPNGNPIFIDFNKYHKVTTETSVSLLINYINVRDTGKYVFSANNSFHSKTLDFWVHLKDKPHIFVEQFQIIPTGGKKVRIPFTIFANFTPKITWSSCVIKDIYTSECVEKSSSSYSNLTQIVSNTETTFEVIIFEPDPNNITKVEIEVTHELGHSFAECFVLSGDIPAYEYMAPDIYKTNLGPDIEISVGQPLELTCKARGLPKPKIKWFKDGNQILPNDNFTLVEYDTILKIQNFNEADYGQYSCSADNDLKIVPTLSSIVKRRSFTIFQIAWAICTIAFLIIVVLYFCIVNYRMKKNFQKLKLVVLNNFEDGALDELDPNLSLNEQADLLPYKRAYEFPRDNLKLGRILGSGAFGVVLQGFAERIIPNEEKTIVAVKMVKRNASIEVLKALTSELKLLVHIGKHLNVVSLLGAVTVNIANRECLVIVEYCHYGSVQNVLLCHRKSFVNQINPETDQINSTPSHEFRPENSFVIANSKRKNNLHSSNSDEADCNYEGYSVKALTITTSDLISWAFQISRGMGYLFSKRVVHRDLAARNVLLCKNNIVKICDFGLSRSIYRNDIYKMQNDTRLPIKWLALESLTDHVFNVRTDVWSFGIMLWEFFSLAEEPYPGMEAGYDFFERLKDGYRMERPLWANGELYNIMVECWSEDPEQRPLFNELETKFSNLLDSTIASHYVRLNETYLKENIQQAEVNYVNLMAIPNQNEPLMATAMCYENTLPKTQTNIPSDRYLEMESKKTTKKFQWLKTAYGYITMNSPNTNKNNACSNSCYLEGILDISDTRGSTHETSKYGQTNV